MNRIFISFLLAVLFFSANTAFSQDKKTITTSFWVGGVCEMCKARIERAVDVKGVRNANYDLEHHTLEITYVPSKISIEKIHVLLNEAGHDTSVSKSTDEKYDSINSCCHYRELHENH
ncbi:MAG: heavy-metal-associated domain-containing protein [Crocinitomicaceae bacterium]|nr:heavy-metal-associated domain-containing protein [Crocinitomicaceae bacterium]